MKRAASIPFIRNLTEYMCGIEYPYYEQLTSLLHCKSDSRLVTQAELDRVFNAVFNKSGSWGNAGESVIDMILAQAELCFKADTTSNFENKIVLSIAIRLISEKFMMEQIDDAGVTDAFSSNQTQHLFGEFRQRFSGDADAIKVLEGVLLMTPEHILLNSFMYEPILDMSDDHLRKLYLEVNGLGGK